jgi:hypothetical protein
MHHCRERVCLRSGKAQRMKKFLLQIQPGADTRWLVDDDTLAHHIAKQMGGVMRMTTGGQIPAITVIREECACEICADQTRQPDAVRG